MSKDRRMGRSQRKRAEADPAMEVRDTVEDVQAMMARKSRGKAKFYDQTSDGITIDERRTLRHRNVMNCYSATGQRVTNGGSNFHTPQEDLGRSFAVE